jgi:hypothetical protein
MFKSSLRVTLWITSALSLVGYLILAGHGLSNSAPYDSAEVAVLEQAGRIANGDGLYRDAVPSTDVGVLPVFPFAVAGLVRLFGSYVWEPRLITLLATLLCAAAAALAVRTETKSGTLAIASAGLLLMGHGLITVGSVVGASAESLMLLIALVGCITLRFMENIIGAVIAAVLFTTAWFTHPVGPWFAMGALIHLAVHDRRRLIAYALCLALFVGGGHVALSMVLGPWFNYFAWDSLFSSMRLQPLGLLTFIGTQLLGALGVLTMVTVLAFALPVQPWRGATGVWGWMAFAALVAGILGTQNVVLQVDALRPVIVALAVVGPVSMQRVTHHLSSWPGASRIGGQGVVLTALVLQFVTLFAHITPMLLGT